jgi:hypothetical protein
MRQQLIAARDVIRGNVGSHSHEQGPDPNYPIQAQANRIAGIGNDQNGVDRKELHDRDHYSGGTGHGGGLGRNSGFLGENKERNSDFHSEENEEQIPLHNTGSPSSTPTNPHRIPDRNHEQIDIIQPTSIEPQQNNEQINQNQNRRSTLSFW